MAPPDAVAAIEHEHLPMRGRFSPALDWPTLEELVPGVTPAELEALRNRVGELNSLPRVKRGGSDTSAHSLTRRQSRI